MKMFRSIALAAALAFMGGGLAACDTLSSLATSVTSTSPAEVTSVAAAEQAYIVAGHLATTWLDSGAATPAQAQVVKSLNNAVYADLVAARTAAQNNDSAAVAVALKLLNQALPALTDYIAAHGGANVPAS